jgi:hypothetical protein
MHWIGVIAGGLVATAALTIVESLGLWLGLSRMSIPIILGTMVSADRDRATFIGTIIHLLVGWAFAVLYALTFEAAGFATWWFGALLGLGHELFMLGVIMPALPAVHPRMASERQGPDPTRALEPPGFLALNYGRQTVLVGAAAHVLYGGILGALYQV